MVCSVLGGGGGGIKNVVQSSSQSVEGGDQGRASSVQCSPTTQLSAVWTSPAPSAQLLSGAGLRRSVAVCHRVS